MQFPKNAGVDEEKEILCHRQGALTAHA